MKTFHTMVLSGALALTLVGCGEEAPPPAPVAVAPKPAAPVEVPKPKPAEAPAASTYVYNYNPVGKRDPFRSPLEDIKATPENTNTQIVACNEPLCQWDIDQLKLVAVVTGDANPMAMVEDPMGRGSHRAPQYPDGPPGRQGDADPPRRGHRHGDHHDSGAGDFQPGEVGTEARGPGGPRVQPDDGQELGAVVARCLEASLSGFRGPIATC